MGFFDKLKQGLGKTKDTFKNAVDSVFVAFSSIDDDFYEELTEALILADLGAQTAMEVVDELKRAR